MAAENFARALDLVLRHEGLWSDYPRDPGGPTMKGITLRTYADFLGRDVSKSELRAIPLDHIKAIYKQGYWDKVSGDDLPAGIDYCAFDAAVNSGPRRAVVWMQKAMMVAADGDFGPKTLAAAKSANVSWAIRRMVRFRLDFLQSLSTWRTFGRGWQSRVDGVERSALAMADGGLNAHSGAVVADEPILRQGDRGEAVRALQAALARYGMHIEADGDFGPKTHIAVKLFQQDNGLAVDGVAGPQTWGELKA